MAQYFNRESGSLAITLRTGKACTIPGKSWIEIRPEEEGSEDLCRVLRAGFVYRFDADEHEPKTSKVQKEETVESNSPPQPVAEVSAPPAETVSDLAVLKEDEKQDPTPEKNSELQRRKKV